MRDKNIISVYGLLFLVSELINMMVLGIRVDRILKMNRRIVNDKLSYFIMFYGIGFGCRVKVFN